MISLSELSDHSEDEEEFKDISLEHFLLLSLSDELFSESLKYTLFSPFF